MFKNPNLVAHAAGAERGDLPIPDWMFFWGSAIAIAISFSVIGFLWTKPKLAALAGGKPVSAATSVGLHGTFYLLRALGLALFLSTLWIGFFGTFNTIQIAFSMVIVGFYIVVWVGAQLLSGIVGDVWRLVNPIATVTQLVTAPLKRFNLTKPAPDWLGHWPAAAGIFVFLFLELIYPFNSVPKNVAWVLTAHLVFSIALAVRYGADWVADNEPFAALFTLIGSMGILFVKGGRLCFRKPMSGLAQVAVKPGTLGLLLVALGGTSFDGFSDSTVGREWFPIRLGETPWGPVDRGLLGLVASIALVTLLYYAGIWWASRVTKTPTKKLARLFAPSLVPIVFGYAIAHYIQAFVDSTQTYWHLLSNQPFSQKEAFASDIWLIDPNVVAWIQLATIVFGHIGAVLIAHDRALETTKPGETLRSQFVMLLVMICYSMVGLWLLMVA